MELAEIDEKLQTSHETDKLKFIKFVQHKCKAGEIDVKAIPEKKSKSKKVKKLKKDIDVKKTEKSKDVKQTEKAELRKAKPELPEADKTKIGKSAASRLQTFLLWILSLHQRYMALYSLHLYSVGWVNKSCHLYQLTNLLL